MGDCMSAQVKGVGKYDDWNWKELPPDVQAAAKVLGYTKQIWDDDGDCECEEIDWDELTPEQREAAVVLGYDKRKWNSN